MFWLSDAPLFLLCDELSVCHDLCPRARDLSRIPSCENTPHKVIAYIFYHHGNVVRGIPASQFSFCRQRRSSCVLSHRALYVFFECSASCICVQFSAQQL
jgi:hypothetical protein